MSVDCCLERSLDRAGHRLLLDGYRYCLSRLSIMYQVGYMYYWMLLLVIMLLSNECIHLLFILDCVFGSGSGMHKKLYGVLGTDSPPLFSSTNLPPSQFEMYIAEKHKTGCIIMHVHVHIRCYKDLDRQRLPKVPF